MNSIAPIFEVSQSQSPLCEAFMRWQCRVRQIAMREQEGRPSDAIMPGVILSRNDEPMGHVITILSKLPVYSRTPELQHICRSTNDPARRREKALQLLSESYYQKHREFSEILTATFLPGSTAAKALEEAGDCRLVFDAYSQMFDLRCRIIRLGNSHPNFHATWWHNVAFNPQLDPETIILGFVPTWETSTAFPEIHKSR